MPDETSAARRACLRDHRQRTRDRCRNGSGRRPQAGHDHVLERVHDARAARLPAGLRRFHKKYPWITVKGTGAITDDKIIAAINGGNAPDALLSFSPNNTGKFCSSGAWQNLNDRIAKEKFDLSQFPKVALSYSGYKGTRCRCPPWPTPTAST